MPDLLTTHCPPLACETLYNIRDLGGYRTCDGRRTLCRRFLRSDAPVRLTQQDIQKLMLIPVHTVVDLRSHSEIRQAPHSLKDCPGIRYHNIPLLGKDLDRDIAALQRRDIRQDQADLVDLYRHIIDRSQEAIGQVLNQLASATAGAALFNCSHGKDRTGLISALLLLLADVKEAMIIEDYQVSARLLKPWFDTFLHEVPKEARIFFRTPPSYMRQTLLYLKQKYQSADRYLQACGVEPQARQTLRDRLLVP